METIVEEPSLNLWSPPLMSCRLNKLKEIYFSEPFVSLMSSLPFFLRTTQLCFDDAEIIALKVFEIFLFL